MYFVLEKSNAKRSWVVNDYLNVIDILGCNSYEDIGRMAKRICSLGFNKFFDTKDFVVACVTDEAAKSAQWNEEILGECVAKFEKCTAKN